MIFKIYLNKSFILKVTQTKFWYFQLFITNANLVTPIRSLTLCVSLSNCLYNITNFILGRTEVKAQCDRIFNGRSRAKFERSKFTIFILVDVVEMQQKVQTNQNQALP